jgi:hypothetical protein
MPKRCVLHFFAMTGHWDTQEIASQFSISATLVPMWHLCGVNEKDTLQDK